jgi:hypothetical protein
MPPIRPPKIDLRHKKATAARGGQQQAEAEGKFGRAVGLLRCNCYTVCSSGAGIALIGIGEKAAP